MCVSDATPVVVADAVDLCPRCLKPAALCICDAVTPIDNNVGLLVLQHPQEQDRLLGTARLATLHLTNSTFKIGLSWPSLAKALGRPADPAEWAILHLGSAKSSDLPKNRELVMLDKKGVAIPDQDRALAGVKGIVIFDGTWSQAKTLWWRNAWVLKAKRLVLNPRRSSLYGGLRREPRREGLSTIEAAALTLSRMEQRPRNRNGSARKFRAYAGALPLRTVTGRLGRPRRPFERRKLRLDCRGPKAPQEAFGRASPSIGRFYAMI